MGNSRPSKLPESFNLDSSPQRDANLTPISDTVMTGQTSSYLVERNNAKLLIAVFTDRIAVIGVNSKKRGTHPLQPGVLITASALCNYPTEPFLLVATSTHSLLKFELHLLFSQDSQEDLETFRFVEPVQYPINAPVTLMDFYDAQMLVVRHDDKGYSRIWFNETYDHYVVKEYYSSDEQITAIISNPKTGMFVIAAKNHLIFLSNGVKNDMPNPMKTALSLAIYPQLFLLFLLAHDPDSEPYIQIWDLRTRALLCEKHLKSEHILTQMLLKPCIQMAGVIAVLLFSESSFMFVLEYSPVPVHLSPAFMLQLDRVCGNLVRSYLTEGSCYLISDSLYSLAQEDFMPLQKTALWTIPVLASSSDLDLRTRVVDLRDNMDRRQVRELGLGLSEAVNRMIRQRPSSAARSRADTNATG